MLGFNLTFQKNDLSLIQITRVVIGFQVRIFYTSIHIFRPKMTRVVLEVSFSAIQHLLSHSSSLSNIPLGYLAQAALQQTTTIRLAKRLSGDLGFGWLGRPSFSW